MISYIIIAIIAYLIGSVNFSVLISKKMAGFDVREKGSGNGGTTNVLRTVGKKAAILTLLADVLKGVIAVLIAYLCGKFIDSNPAILLQVAAIGVVVGHTFPIFFGFRGGKGIATSLGILLLLNWQIGLICLLFAISLMAVTRMVSLRFNFCSSVISNPYYIYSGTLFGRGKLSNFWNNYGCFYYI